jgi:hypothetical protein
LDGASRVLLVAEYDGMAKLVSVEIPSVKETALYSFARGEATPSDAVVFGGQFIGVFSGQSNTALRCFQPGEGFRPLATLRGRVDSRLKERGPFAYLATGELSPEREVRSHLHEVSLRDGTVRRLTDLLPETHTRGAVKGWVMAGDWMAIAIGTAGVQLFAQGQPRGSFVPPPGQALWSMGFRRPALSQS